jgi:SWI/SNF-related matrix-associated actin-dependent regulator of chromatin subfamily A3
VSPPCTFLSDFLSLATTVGGSRRLLRLCSTQGSISTGDTKKLNIVGTQYYPGEAHEGEFVKLVREPHNPYDRNAIKVNNMQGQQVGHIKRETAAILSPLMHRNPEIKVDATIPWATFNSYTIPIQIDFYGPDPNQADSIMNLFESFRKAKAKKKKAAPKRDTTTAAANSQVTVQTKKLDWKSQQQQLDDMFHKQSKQQLENLPDLEMPPQLTQDLFLHQIEGIKWLYQREQGTQPVPFYELVKEGGRDVWFCDITNASQVDAPKPVLGSILADDMGLGST